MDDSEGMAKSGGKGASWLGRTDLLQASLPELQSPVLGAGQPWVLLDTLHGPGKLFNHPKPLIPHLCNGVTIAALTELSRGLAEMLCVIHLALCLASNQLPVKR